MAKCTYSGARQTWSSISLNAQSPSPNPLFHSKKPLRTATYLRKAFRSTKIKKQKRFRTRLSPRNPNNKSSCSNRKKKLKVPPISFFSLTFKMTTKMSKKSFVTSLRRRPSMMLKLKSSTPSTPKKLVHPIHFTISLSDLRYN